MRIHTHTHIHSHTCTYSHICTYTHTHAHTFTNMHIQSHTCTYTHAHMHIHSCTYTHTHAHIFTYMHIHSCTHMHTLMHTCTYTHTHLLMHMHTHTTHNTLLAIKKKKFFYHSSWRWFLWYLWGLGAWNLKKTHSIFQISPENVSACCFCPGVILVDNIWVPIKLKSTYALWPQIPHLQIQLQTISIVKMMTI